MVGRLLSSGRSLPGHHVGNRRLVRCSCKPTAAVIAGVVMRQTVEIFGKITRILDGQPTGKHGQSLVEMALTAPILVVLILGLVEIGFLANDYMVLLDAVRAAGRAAVNLDPTGFPAWHNASNDKDGARNQQRMDCDESPDWMT